MNGRDNAKQQLRNVPPTRRKRRAYYRFAEKAVNGPPYRYWSEMDNQSL
jgi:hypothetical protein